MLLRFEASNHRSIATPVDFSMIAVDEDRAATRSFDLLTERVLTVAGIYGANASGKSNILEAIAWLSAFVRSSLRAWEDHIPREPFRFAGWSGRSSNFEIEMIVDGIRYTYVVELDDTSVLFEALYSYPERRQRTLFVREGMNLSFRRGLHGQPGTRELLTPTTLALSAAMRFDEPQIRAFARALSGIEALGFRRTFERDMMIPSGASLFLTRRLFDIREPVTVPPHDGDIASPDALEPHTPRDRALALLRFADLGIDDVQIIEEPAAEFLRSGSSVQGSRNRLRLVHTVAGERVPFDLHEESEGTRMWFRLIGPILHALKDGQTLLFDEIDASLHPRLSARLLELFQDPDTNPRGAQLVFTSHDTSLLNHLNRDEVWLTEKGDDGATSLTALAEFGGDKVRRSLNLEKAYLQGRFGGVPELDQYLLRQALGLTSDHA